MTIFIYFCPINNSGDKIITDMNPKYMAMSNTSNTTISNQELDKLREYEFILHELQKTARIGWWKVDFNTHQITCSEYIVEILGLDRNEMSIEQFFSLVNAKHRQRISKNF